MKSVFTSPPIAIIPKRCISFCLAFFFFCSAYAQPVISGFSPSTGPAGTEVTITGTGFSTTLSENHVWLGGARCAITSATATQLVVTLPAQVASHEQFMYTNTSTNLTCLSMNRFLLNYTSLTGYSYSSASFTAAQTYTVGGGGVELGSKFVLTDIDEDNKMDIALYTASGFDILYNTSTEGLLNAGSFNRVTVTSNVSTTGFGTRSHTLLGDFNSDGKIDFFSGIYGNTPYNQININSSTSGFSLAPTVTVSGGAEGMAPNITDINQDGKLDYVSSYFTYGYIRAGRNTSTGSSFSMANAGISFYGSNTDNRLLKKADLNFDGIEDLVEGTTAEINSKINVRRNATAKDETVINSFSYVLDASPAGPNGTGCNLEAVDLDGDGKPDLVQSYTSLNRIVYWRNTTTTSGGTLSFDTYGEVLFTGMNKTLGIAVADFNADGKPDLIVSASNSIETSTAMYYLENTSTGAGDIQFASPVTIAVNTPTSLCTSLSIMDYDGDGYPDIIGAPSGGAIRVLRNLMAPTVRIGSSEYLNLKTAFDAINAGTHTGALEVEIFGNPNESVSAVLNASGTGSADYSSISIYPTEDGRIVSGNINGVMIDLDGADNVTIDGRENRTGTTGSLTIENLNTSTATTIRFINSAENNTLRYSTIKGQTGSSTTGIILLATASAGNGNSGNIIEYCNITTAGSSGALQGIHSAGSSSPANNNNIIRNNNFYDIFRTSSSSNAIYLASNTTNTSISGNSFYETVAKVVSSSNTYQYVRVQATTVTGTTIENNYFGGAEPLAAGSPLTFSGTGTPRLYPISAGGGSLANPTSIQNNVIRNIAYTSGYNTSTDGGYFSGILIDNSSYTNVGTVTGNTIGDQSSTGSIVLNPRTSLSYAYGIFISGGTSVTLQNNTIGGITVSGLATVTKNFIGINDYASSGTHLISNNTIGSPSTLNSIQCTGTATSGTEEIVGIRKNGSVAGLTISGNTIANISTLSTGSGSKRLAGIQSSSSGNMTIQNNIIYNLSTSSETTNTGASAALTGISVTFSAVYSISGNAIYNLSSGAASTAVNIYGIVIASNAVTTSSVFNNFIHSIDASTTSTSAVVSGIFIGGGLCNYYNNIISLGYDIAGGVLLYGINDVAVSTSGSARSFQFNTIYLNGEVADGTLSSALSFTSALPTGRTIRNNILYNSRSNTAGTAKHYALYITGAPASTTINYNNYFTSGTGGVTGSYNGADITTLPFVTGQDANSAILNPGLTNAGSVVATDYESAAGLIGITVAGITGDYTNATRDANPTIGALESINMWMGSSGTSYSNTANWSKATVPGAGQPILFSSAAMNDLELDQDRTAGTINFSTSGKKLVLGNYNLEATDIQNGGAENYIKTTGTGKLILAVPDASNLLFPVGNSTYNPLTITNNTGSIDNFSVRILDEVYSAGLSGNALSSTRITRTWDISKTNPNAGAGIDLHFEWLADQNTGVTDPALYHYDGTWNEQTEGTSSAPTSTSFSYTGYTGTFSPFAIFGENQLLPVIWKSFTAQKQGDKAVLNWQTSAEQNTRDYTVQHSKDGASWKAIGYVKAAGNSSITSSYSFVHQQPAAGENFYRLLQTDLDGRSDYSATVKLMFSQPAVSLAAYPNPVINGDLTIRMPQAATVSLFNATGVLMVQKQLNAGIQKLELKGLAKGPYYLRAGSETITIIIQ